MGGNEAAPRAQGREPVRDPAADTPASATRARLLQQLPALLRELAASHVVELEVVTGDARLFLRQRPGPPASIGTQATLPAAGADPAPATEEDEAGLVAITTPLSGVFYASPSPSDPPYVQAGHEIEVGQVVALIEAMKVFNEIRADVAGTVVRVLIESGRMVPKNTPLLLVRPRSGSTQAHP